MYALMILLAVDIIISIIMIISNKKTLKEIKSMISELSQLI